MKHLSIEGMDGVGKSTTCKLLAEKLGYIFVEKPTIPSITAINETNILFIRLDYFIL